MGSISLVVSWSGLIEKIEVWPHKLRGLVKNCIVHTYIADVTISSVMGRGTRTAKKVYKCKICKKDFGSYQPNSREKLSHRTHRNHSAFCLSEQRRLREEYRAAGNTDEIIQF